MKPPAPVSGNLFLDLQQVTFASFNKPELQNISWTIREGEIWAITGSAGAGKTTLAEALAGRLRVQRGKVAYYFTSHPEKIEDPKRLISLVTFQPQTPELNYANFYYQQRFNSSDSADIKTVEEFLIQTTAAAAPPNTTWKKVIQLLNLQDLLHLAVIKLSNGQTRKMLMAQALLRQPRLLILDNPFSGLDTDARQDLKKIIKSLTLQGTQVIMVVKPTEIPDYITHVLELEQFKVKGIYSRPAFLVAQKAKHNKLEEPGLTVEELNLFKTQLAPDFAIGVKFENTTIRYDEKIILDRINWTVQKGEKWALLGPNGSGKTTLLSLINGDNPQAFANKITLFDRPKGSGESIWEIKKRIGFVSPELHLYFRHNLTAEKVVATGFYDTLYPKRPLTTEEDRLVQNFFEYYGFEHLRQKSFLQLSVGEQRVILLIRSLIKNPHLLIWDEPYQGLTDSLIQKTQNLLAHYATPAKTVIFVSHYEQEIPDWVKKRIYLEEGRVKKITFSPIPEDF